MNAMVLECVVYQNSSSVSFGQVREQTNLEVFRLDAHIYSGLYNVKCCSDGALGTSFDIQNYEPH